ncbi:hypothetical protein COL60_05830 [Bacillus pseudomycoides]|nr:hypothetical protein COL60_05830 [Bacillus pseudomycoides]
MKRSVVMRIKGVLISFLVLITFLGFLPIEKASASVSSNPVNEVGDRIDTSKNYYIARADNPNIGLYFPWYSSIMNMQYFQFSAPGDPVKLHYSEENKKYRIEMFVKIISHNASTWFTKDLWPSINNEQFASYWTIRPVDGGYTIQAEDNRYLSYHTVEWGKIWTTATLSTEKVVWKLVPAS